MGYLAMLSVVVLVMVSYTASQSIGSGCTTPQGQSGVCTQIRNCPSLAGLLQRVKQGTAPSGALDTLRQSICSFMRNEPLVCCTSTAPVPPPTRAPPTRRPPPVVLPPAPLPFPSPAPNPQPGQTNFECGNRGIQDKIIDGEDAPLGAWPWMVVLRGSVQGRRTWFCGGVLVSDRYVLSAAHCFKEGLGLVLEIARIGEHTLSSDPDCSKGTCAPQPQDISVKRIIRHPQYGVPCAECNDIAMLELSQPATMHSGFVTPVCLPDNPLRDMGFSEQQFQGKAAYAAGWGSTARDFTVTRRPDVLQQVLLPIQELDYCNRLRASYPDRRMALCAGGERKDTCRGDSGGPLTLENNFGTKVFVVGITSLGPRSCGSTETQGLYTNVAYYMDWIRNTMRS